MKSSLSHLQLNINYDNISFYKELMQLLGWSEIMSDEGIIGFNSAQDENLSVWYIKAPESGTQNYDSSGMNHVGFNVETQQNVDEVVAFLKQKNIAALFETPRHRPEFAFAEGQTYYQVMFESPDKILYEIMYTGPKNSS